MQNTVTTVCTVLNVEPVGPSSSQQELKGQT